jgi:hypothetical protein
MPHTVYTLDVRLRDISPPIWRTIEIVGSSTLEDLHFALQVAMGWTNSHLHQFMIGDASYGMADADEADDLDLEDECGFRLQDLVKRGDSFVYEYDFGDSWEHDVTVKQVAKITEPPEPRCTGGARACPPEDCGGIPGYENLLAALADPSHDEHTHLVEWSENFQPERFEIPRSGRDLRREIDQLKALAEEDDGDEDDDELDESPVFGLPKPLIEAVLALDPLQRASLGAVIVGSLADELVEMRAAAAAAAQRVDAREQPSKPARTRRKGGR